MFVEVLLEVSGNVVSLHGQVELADVLLELLGAKKHAEEKPGIYIGQCLVTDGIYLGTWRNKDIDLLGVKEPLKKQQQNTLQNNP